MKKYLKLLIGFPIGIFMLVITYIFVYFIAGEATYISEMSKLLEFNFMIEQVIFSGIIYIILFFGIQAFIDAFSEQHLTWKGLRNLLIKYALIIVICLIASMILDRQGTLNDYIQTIFFGISILLMIICSICYAIYQAIQNHK